jgi:hypothetical protein
MRVVLLAALLICGVAHAVEPWQKVLVLGNEATDIGQLLNECEFKATVTAKGAADTLTRRIAEQALEAGGNVVHILGASSVDSTFSFKQQGTINGRAFYCSNVGALTKG